MSDKTITGVPNPRWWQRHPTLALCTAWILGLGVVGTALAIGLQAAA